MYHIFVYVPDDCVDSLKQVLFDVGVGKFGNYSECVWQTSGVGQFRALDMASPHIGGIGEITHVKETKLEFYCEAPILDRVISALKLNHPYETPANGVIKLEQY